MTTNALCAFLDIPPDQLTILVYQNEQPDFTMTTSYFNQTSGTVTMVQRSGNRIPIMGQRGACRDEFMIRQEMRLGDYQKEALKRYYDNYIGPRSARFTRMEKEFRQQYSACRGYVMSLRLDYKVTLNQFKEHNGALYIMDLDIILVLEGNDIPEHPLDMLPVGKFPDANREMKEEPMGGIAITINDPEKRIGDRYANIMGRIVHIKAQRVATAEEGVHVCIEHGMDIHGKALPKRYCIPYDEIDDTHWLHKSFSAAKNAPSQDTLYEYEMKKFEREAKELALEVTRLKTQADLDKANHETLEREMKQVMMAMEHEQKQKQMKMEEEYSGYEHRRKMDSIDTKDYYENRSSIRKDSSEIVKWVPAIVVGVVAVFAAIKSIFF